MKACPFCAEQIQDAAIFCKHCKRDLVSQHPNDAKYTETCPFCKAAVPRGVNVCPACGDDLSGVAGGTSATVGSAAVPAPARKKTSIGAWFALIVIILVGLGWLGSSTSSTPNTVSNGVGVSDGIRPGRNAPEITAVALFEEYKENEVAADQRWKGNWARISGEIDKIGKDILDQPYVTLKTADILGTVQAMFSKSDENMLANFQQGRTLTVICRIDGKMMNVIGRSCRIPGPEDQ